MRSIRTLTRVTPTGPTARTPRRGAASTRLSFAALTLAAVLGSAAAPAAWAAGAVTVQFVKPEQFADIGRTHFDRQHALEVLQGHLEQLGQRLPDGSSLVVEVLDVELAGDQNPLRWDGVRVLRGNADWPRMQLRWRLLEGAAPGGRVLEGAAPGGRVLKSGEDQIHDMAYLTTSPPLLLRGESFAYERRMLTRWFDEKVLPASR